MPYDPQRSHRRPRLADDTPAPIDALLGNGSDPEPSPSASSAVEPDVVESTEVVEVLPEPPESHGLDTEPRGVSPDVELAAPGGRGRHRLAVIAVALLVVVLVLAWLRRRR